MRQFIKAAAAGAVVAAALAATPALGAYSDTLANFMTAGAVTDGIYTYTYVSASAGLTGYAGTAQVNITPTGTAPLQFTNFQLSNLAGLTNLTDATYTLEYTIELYASAPASNPDIRFQTIGLGADVSSAQRNIGTSKHVVGQPTVIVPSPTFNKTLNTTPTSLSTTLSCGVCRKFLVTDTITMRYNPANPRGSIRSLSNDYDTIPVPEPASLALFGLGFAAMGARNLRRKSKTA